MDRLVRNVVTGLRAFRRDPGFAVTAALTLALGIGLATAVFTVAQTLLIHRLPVRDQDRIVVVSGENNWPLEVSEAKVFAERSRAFDRVAWFHYAGAYPIAIIDGDRIARLRRALVSGAFFDMLEVRPVLGRTLHPSDDVTGAAPVAVLSYPAWRARFAADPRVLGKTIALFQDSTVYRIIGVMPEGMSFPRGADFWAPFGALAVTAQVNVIGRLASTATAANARDEMTAFFQRSDAPNMGDRNRHGVVQSLTDLVVGDVRPALFAFSAACGLLLLITCINVANLLLVRGVTRVQEINLRHALGANRRRLLGDLLAENIVLAALGGVLGLVVAIVAVRCVVAFAPSELPRVDEIHINATALIIAIAVTGLATLLFAMAPAFVTSRLALRHGASRPARRAGEALAAGQIALALLVLSVAGLIARSLIKLERAQLAFDPSHVLVGELSVRDQLASVPQLAAAIRAIPGVRGASPVVAAPFSGTSGWDGQLMTEGQSPDQAARNPLLNMEVVSPDYFATLGVAVLRGRAFTNADHQGALPVVMVSQSAADALWPRGEAIGQRISLGRRETWFTVVGIVPDTRYRDLRTARPSIYYPVDQTPFGFAPWNLVIRTSGPPAAIVPTLRQVIAEQTGGGVALASAEPFATYLDRPLAQPRLDALLLAVFAVTAAALAAVGLFGVMAATVRQRTHELRVRTALGATGRDLWRMVMRRGLAIASVGATLGVIGALLGDRLVRSMLYEVSPTDPLTLGSVATALFIIATLAVAGPAWSGAQVDPAKALRGGD